MKIAVIGATGAVGREIVEALEESPLADLQLIALASARSEGQMLSFRGRRVTVQPYSLAAVQGCSYALMSAGGRFSSEHALAIAEVGCLVIDNSSAWRMDPAVPLVVPEVNAAALAELARGIVANPNCSTIQMVVALEPLRKHFGLSLVQVATYQSVSGTGQKGINELSAQVQARLKFAEPVAEVYPQPIAFNILAHIGALDEAGHCEEEVKMVCETRRILGLPELTVLATTARVPVFHCHSEAVSVCLAKPASRAEILAAWQGADGLVYHADAEPSEPMPSPWSMTGQAHVAICRLRLPWGSERSPWLQFWNVADNLKKGAATNAVQIMHALVERRR